MQKDNIIIGVQKLKFTDSLVKGELLSIDGEEFYKISNYDKMDPFLVSVVSPSDHWIYISSNGGLTAGRKNPDNALFPYSTDDLIHDCNETTGSKTIIKVFQNDDVFLWEPFANNYIGVYDVSRNLYKNISGTKIIFEEINEDLQLIFKYGWTTSNKFGLVKFSELINNSDETKQIEVLDGIRNVLPAGVYQQLQTEFSTLVDGYKKNELIEKTNLGVYSLSSIPSDRAMPSESLSATTVFGTGIKKENVLLSVKQLDNFRKNLPLQTETQTKGIRGAYFINSKLELEKGISKEWYITAEVNQNSGDLAQLNNTLMLADLNDQIKNEIQNSRKGLRKIVGQADGIQLSSNKLLSARHFSNVMFNVMRGGIFYNSYYVGKEDFILFLKNANPFVIDAHSDFLAQLPEQLLHFELYKSVEEIGDPHFTKLALEYMPLTFSRRHGDPSRPWNRFSIDVRNERDEHVLNYQGNWRDIFQNWEALALSYPKFLESIISKFLNNSTADGYNPYRIFRDGFDWEELEPENPWANIGYWGDHQIIYLLKLLELSKEFNPGALERLLTENIFSFANVPYRIKHYRAILNNPRDTIIFDSALDRNLRNESVKYGWDVQYLKKADYSLVQVGLVEKLLLTLLTKISNYIPGGGIWMNTQRPEWNDANNALVGYGISMVTLYYLRRYVKFLSEFLSDLKLEKFEISEEVSDLFKSISITIDQLSNVDISKLSDKKRKEFVEHLGESASTYRTKIYNKGFSGTQESISKDSLITFLNSCESTIDDTIIINKREDGLYHSYNILSIKNDEMGVSNLYEMLEGQVAVLSSGYLSADQSIELLISLKKSMLYREDQNSYLLYPNKELTLFIDKNNVSKELIAKSKLLKMLLEDDSAEIIYRDVNGDYHFQSDMLNSEILSQKLERLENESKYNQIVKKEREYILEIYEKTFSHKQFTGRATTFYKYEGLGSIYWHMVSKLLLAVQEVCLKADKEKVENEKLGKLIDIYYDIKQGIGIEKSPDKYGAFPTDAYSHTPSFSGVQQPGMTGQVKEDILSRIRELGVIINNGRIVINSSLLNFSEFTTKEESFKYYDLSGIEKELIVEKNSIAFTYCQVPFVYTLSNQPGITLLFSDGTKKEIEGIELNEKLSDSIFSREGKIELVKVSIKK
jgi:uncharacterized protein YacL (UPF0231 family)